MRIFYTVFIFLFLIACRQIEGEQEQNLSGEALSEIYCSSCHAYPGPELLTRDMWRNVLPHMALRLGAPADGVDPYADLKMEDIRRIKVAGVFPEQPLVADTIWRKIEDFYLANAPDSLLLPAREPRSNNSPFHSRIQPLDLTATPFVSMVKFDEAGRLYLAGWNGDFMRLNKGFDIDKIAVFPRPIVDFNYDQEGNIIALSIGDLYPNEGRYGAVAALDTQSFSGPRLLFDKLPRPVSFEIADLNNDGLEDLLVCNFGNNIGNLSWYQNTGSGYRQHFLKKAPGATRARLHDMDGDGDQDIVVLFAQGDEGISIFYNVKGAFRERQVLRFHPLYGSNDFELVDFDRDGDQDIVLSNGDNGDHSIMLKPYHGVRIFLNEEETFSEQFFFPMYGASKVRARDFDLDGDIDLVAASFFPDTRDGLDQSVVYLENEGNWQFAPSHFPHADQGRWMVMDAGDIDGDGDPDVVLGSFTLTTQGIDQQTLEQWRTSGNHVLFLENRTVR